VICEPKAVVIMNGLLDIYDQPEDRAALDQAVVEEIRRGSMLDSASYAFSQTERRKGIALSSCA
jgi:hypothetical protein